MITDSHCGARHLSNSHLGPAECARACVRKGASYVLVDGERRYTLTGGEDILGRLAGERVNVSGTRQGQTILVSSAAPVFCRLIFTPRAAQLRLPFFSAPPS